MYLKSYDLSLSIWEKHSQVILMEFILTKRNTQLDEMVFKMYHFKSAVLPFVFQS